MRLTPRGRESIRTIRDAVRRVEADWSRRIGAEQVAEPRRILWALVDTLEGTSGPQEGARS